MTGAALWGGVGPHPWPRAGGMNASSLFKPLLCPQLFGDVCYTCSHVIEGDGEAPPPPARSLCPLPAPAPVPCTLWACGSCSCVPSCPSLRTGGPVADLWGH